MVRIVVLFILYPTNQPNPSGDIVSAERAVAKYCSCIDAKSAALLSEVDNCKRLQALQEKADQCIENVDLRTAVFQIDNALKIAPASARLKLQKAECLAQLGRIEVKLNICFIQRDYQK